MNLAHCFIYVNLIGGIGLAGWIGLRQRGAVAVIPAVLRKQTALFLFLYSCFGACMAWYWIQGFSTHPGWMEIIRTTIDLGLVIVWMGWMLPASSLYLRGLHVLAGILPYLFGWFVQADGLRHALQFQWMQICLVIGCLRFNGSQIATDRVVQVRDLLSIDWCFGAFLLGITLQSLCNTLIFFAISSPLASLCTWIIIGACFSFSFVPIALAKATLCYPKPHSKFC